ncbi:chitin deacetylase [Tilletia horrida]|uniref:chitin deacetylase n=1 Tax=Tilletia horrida TaxID=155126 RepID=A0AAN6GT28_9BASI|nr:chitin deacetylase [Tilletia horrida]KAK0556122.1 chitin deacetylase [Tilletia horrida]KAK0569047.1 chitin deacetylase [Tilletia horrida]
MVRLAAVASACVVAASLLPASVGANNNLAPSPRLQFERRQASSATTSSKHHHSSSSANAGGSGASTTPAAAAAPTSAPSVSGSVSIPASVLAILSTITSGTDYPYPTPTTISSTPSAGAQNTYIPKAPPLPNFAALSSNDYPDLDILPSKSTRASVLAQNKQWLSAVDFSSVPNITPSQDGSCASDPQLAAQAAQNGWWTCGGYTRSTDVTTCPQTNTFGLSYDDGPSPGTPAVLQYLDQHNLKATFFLVGSRAISRPEMVAYEYITGHQLSVHTWSHPSLTTLSNADIYLELRWTMKIIEDITGVVPNTMRPPYGDIDDRVRAICKLLNLTPIIWTGIGTEGGNMETFDTEDWQIASGVASSQQVYTNFANIFKQAPSLSTGYIVLAHDLYAQSCLIATEAILPLALAASPKQSMMPIVQCMLKPLGDAYVQTDRNISGLGPAATPSGSSAVSGAGATGTPGSSGNSSGAERSTSAFYVVGTLTLAMCIAAAATLI